MPKRPTQGPEPRVPLNRERVLRAAVALADEHGLESLTMRELGLRLGVEAMSLYNHVANKDDILDGMVDLVVGEIDLPADAADWKQAMRAQGDLGPGGLLPSSVGRARLIDARESSGPARLRYLDWVVGTLRRAGFTLETALRAFSLLDSYIYGFGRQQLNMSAGGDAEPEEMAEAFLRALPADEYPYLRECRRPRDARRVRRKRRLRSSGSTSSSTGSRGYLDRTEGESSAECRRAHGVHRRDGAGDPLSSGARGKTLIRWPIVGEEPRASRAGGRP